VTATRRRNLILIACAAGLVLLLAFFTNPDQAAHVRAIKETSALRRSSDPSFNSEPMFLQLEYCNYFLFSTTSVANAPMTRGYFGKIETTDNIRVFF
jgi:hypothetical protein